MGWFRKQQSFGLARRPVAFVKRELMWSKKKYPTTMRVVVPEMDPVAGSMLKDLSGNVIVYDYFIRSGYFYMISTYWANDSPVLDVLINGEPVSPYGYQEHMPTRYYKYPMTDTGLVWVTINGVEYELMPDIIKPSHHKFGIVLTFKYESAAWIRRFLEYYRKQGVDAFYFYYNGPELPADLVTGPDIKYIVWDCKFKIYENQYVHNAQTQAYTSFRWRYYDDCDWIAVVDFDEFICDIYDKERLVNLLGRTDCDVVMMDNHWATVSDSGGLITYSKKTHDFNYEIGRTKCIYNTLRYRGEISIHLPKDDCILLKSRQIVFFHIIDCLHPERKDSIVEPIFHTTATKLIGLSS